MSGLRPTFFEQPLDNLPPSRLTWLFMYFVMVCVLPFFFYALERVQLTLWKIIYLLLSSLSGNESQSLFFFCHEWKIWSYSLYDESCLAKSFIPGHAKCWKLYVKQNGITWLKKEPKFCIDLSLFVEHYSDLNCWGQLDWCCRDAFRWYSHTDTCLQQ